MSNFEAKKMSPSTQMKNAEYLLKLGVPIEILDGLDAAQREAAVRLAQSAAELGESDQTVLLRNVTRSPGDQFLRDMLRNKVIADNTADAAIMPETLVNEITRYAYDMGTQRAVLENLGVEKKDITDLTADQLEQAVKFGKQAVNLGKIDQTNFLMHIAPDINSDLAADVFAEKSALEKQGLTSDFTDNLLVLGFAQGTKKAQKPSIDL